MQNQLRLPSLSIPTSAMPSLQTKNDKQIEFHDANKIPNSVCFTQKQIAIGQWQALMYFRMHIYLCLILAILSALSIYLTVRNIQSTNSSSNNIWINTLNIVNSAIINAQIHKQQQIIKVVIVSLLCLFLILVALFGRKPVDKLLENMQIGRHSPQGFSVLCKYSKICNFSEQQIKNMVKSWWQVQTKVDAQHIPEKNTQNLIQKIIFFYNLELFQEIKEQIQQIQQKKKYMNSQVSTKNKQNQFSMDQRNSVHNLFNQYNRLQSLKERIRNQELDKTNKCLIIFKMQQYAHYFLTQNQSYFCHKHIINKPILPGQTTVTLLIPPYPRQTYYEKQHYQYLKTSKNKCINRFLIGMLTVTIVTIMSFGSVAGFSVLYGSNLQEHWAIINAFILVIITIISNKLATLFTQCLQIQPSKNRQQFSILLKKTIIVISVMIVSIIPSIILIPLQNLTEFIASSAFVCCLNLSIIFPFSLIINKATIQYKCKQKQKTDLNKLQTQITYINHKQNLLTPDNRKLNNSSFQNSQIPSMQINRQLQAQKLLKQLQKYNFRFGLNTPWLIYTFIITLFYSPLLPILIPLNFIGIILHYVMSRIAIIKLSTGLYPSGAYIYHQSIKLLAFGPLIYTLGSILCNIYIYYITLNGPDTYTFPEQTILIIQIIMIVISVLILFVVRIIINFNKYVPPSTNSIYKQCSDDFGYYSSLLGYNNYQHENPVYKYIKLSLHKNLRNCSSKYLQDKQILLQQLNTMSKSLTQTLKQRLFAQQKSNRIPVVTKRDIDDSIYFEYEQKIEMPQPKSNNRKPIIPPIFKHSEQDKLLQKKLQKQKRKRSKKPPVMKFNQLFSQEDDEDENMKNIIKQKIRVGIKKIK